MRSDRESGIPADNPPFCASPQGGPEGTRRQSEWTSGPWKPALRFGPMDLLSAEGWAVFLAALVCMTALAALAGFGLAVILKNRAPLA